MDSYITPVPYPSAPMQVQHDVKKIVTGPATEITEDQIKVLVEQGFTRGLAKSLSMNNAIFPLRIWVVDNRFDCEQYFLYLYLQRCALLIGLL